MQRLILLILLLSTPPAFAQFGVSNPSRQLDRSLPITSTDIEILDTVFGLDEAQQELVNALFRDFEQRFREAIRDRELRINELVDDGLLMQNSDVLADAQQIWMDWKDERIDMIRFVHEHIPGWQKNEQLAAELRQYAERIDPPCEGAQNSSILNSHRSG